MFDPIKELVLTTDASEREIAAVFSQEGHTIIYLTRNLTVVEINYSNIEEVLAIVWSAERAHNLLLVKKFLIKSNYKPLEFIFNPKKELPNFT